MPTVEPLARRIAGLVALCTLVAAGCSAGDSPRAVGPSTPTRSVPGVPELPAGAATPGTELSPGQPARVVFAPTRKRSGYLRIRIDSVRTGSVSDLRSFTLDPRTRRSTPYYVDVTLTSLGRGDVGGTAVPLLGVSGRTVALPAADIVGSFPRCQTKPIPRRFGSGRRFSTCLMFLSPQHRKLTGVEFQYSPKGAPVLWEVEPKPRRKDGAGN